MRRRVPSLVLALATLALCACGQLPRPFEHQHAGANPLAELAFDVRLEPVVGLEPADSTILTTALAETLGGFGVTATDRPGLDSHFRLAGRLVRHDGNGPLLRWTLSDRDGDAVGLHDQPAPPELAATPPLPPELLAGTGTRAAKPLAALIQADAELPEAETAPPPAAPSVALAGIEGAPGDGNAALAEALAAAFKAAGHPLTPGGNTDFAITGQVSVGPGDGRQQPIGIAWTVHRADGTEVGTANQENMVPVGRLDLPWGPLADLIADAAAPGLLDILAAAGKDSR